VAAAGIPCEHGPLGCQVMDAGKHYFTDKTPFTTFEQLERAKAVAARTSCKYMVYFSERLHVESAVFATDLVRKGAIGRVIQVLGLGPHRLSKSSRPGWFFEKAKCGGILCDIASHQCDQFLVFSGATDAVVVHAAVGNFGNPDKPEFEDFGEAGLRGNNGASGYMRVDWFTAPGLGTWGDGRTVILGTEGTIELRKYVDIARDPAGDHVYLVDGKGEHHYSVAGQVGFPFFGQLILDCLNRTEHAMTQAHVFKAAELCLAAQAAARRVT
jgi:predicted dehydrogenase